MIDEEMADNVLDEIDDYLDTFNEPDSPTEEVPTTGTGSDVDTTKAFSKRLKEETTKIRNEERQNIASSFGYDNWDEFVKTQTDSKILDKGFDPEEVRPIFEDFKKNDPEYQEAMKYKKEREELDKRIWAQNCLKDLNSKFGTTFTEVNQLDRDTVDAWNGGMPLDKAYAANHYETLLQKRNDKPAVTGKEHLTQTSKATTAETPDSIGSAEMQVFKMFNPSATEEDILNFKKAQNK